jgi:hypothetical protein
VSVCRVLSISRTAYMALAGAFPLSAERMLDNLMQAAQEVRPAAPPATRPRACFLTAARHI